MFEVGQRVVTTDTIFGDGGTRILHEGATGTVHHVSENIVSVKIDGDEGFMSQDGCWKFSRDELFIVNNISVNRDAVHLLSKD